MPDTFYLTTPIYYVNARPHIGHAYTTIVADVLARRARAQGTDTWFLTGTDEHGQKIERSAAAAGIPPQQFADQVSAEFKQLWDRMGLTYDQYLRTTDDAHMRGVQKLFTTLQQSGHIYLSSYTGQYCVSEEIFVEGPPGTIGPDGRPTETVTEENYFFRLSSFQLPLLDLIESDTLEITPAARKNELLSFLRGNTAAAAEAGGPSLEVYPEGGIPDEVRPSSPGIAYTAKGTPYVPGNLRDLSISRSSFTWGIPVPGDPKHVIYVWLDALANYMTAVGYGDETRTADFAKWWPANLHLVGKEITRQHCIYWPAFLMAAGLPLPKKVVAHGWLLFEESKMSKSRGNIVRTETILDAFGTLCPPATPTIEPTPLLSSRSEAEGSAVVPATPTKHRQDLFAADVLRYFLLREIPFGQDGSFSFDALITRYNADLANGYGNLVSRVLAMIAKSSNGVVDDAPEAHSLFIWEQGMPEMVGATEGMLLGWHATELVAKIGKPFAVNAFADAITLISTFLTEVDRFITSRKPWAATDTEISQRGRRQTLYTAAESIRIITALLHPILPYATANVWCQLGLGDIEQAAANGELRTENLQWGGLQPGTRLGPLSPVFPRADKKLAEIMTQMEQDKNTPASPANAAHDASTQETTEFKEAPIASEAAPAGKSLSKLVDETSGHTAITNPSAFDPAAGPRTSNLAEPNPGLHVGGSNAVTTERPGTPSHTEAHPSGIFSGQASGPEDASPQITIDDFAKVELRIAKVIVCERIPKADKLLRLEVDLGYEKRQILSGIAEWYTPEDLLGRRIVVITNLAPRKMRGLESHGMLLAASSEGGKPALATFLDSDDLPLGSRLK